MYKVYQIVSGDTIESIAEKFNISANDLGVLNGLNKNQILTPGMYIVVPTTKNNFDTYYIVKGDTLYSISTKFNVPLDILLLINGLNKDDYIYPGETLLIPKNGIGIYLTKEGDTISDLDKYDLNRILEMNQMIYLKPQQIVLYEKKE